jgi:hypothetical protein
MPVARTTAARATGVCQASQAEDAWVLRRAAILPSMAIAGPSGANRALSFAFPDTNANITRSVRPAFAVPFTAAARPPRLPGVAPRSTSEAG